MDPYSAYPQAPVNHHWFLLFLAITVILIVARIIADAADAPSAITLPLDIASGICGTICLILLLFMSALVAVGLVALAAIMGGVYYAVASKA
jgi:hypothetical protein